MNILFEIIFWSFVFCFYIGTVIWAFKDWLDMDNLLYQEDEEWYNSNDDEHLGV